MANDQLFDANYWYVVNDHFKHIVYRNKDKEKAVRYAKNKNRYISRSGLAGIQYSVISGFQAQQQNFKAIGHLAENI